jgi:hypothetical protein
MPESDDRLLELLESVSDERSFLAFVKSLAADFAADRKVEAQSPSNPNGPSHLGWENWTLDAVLESGAAWAEDTAGNPGFAASRENPWRLCAWVLYYE